MFRTISKNPDIPYLTMFKQDFQTQNCNANIYVVNGREVIKDVERHVVNVTDIAVNVGCHVVDEQGVRTSHISLTCVYTRDL